MNEFALTPAEARNTALETVDGAEMIVDLTSAVTSYCSLVAETEESKVTLYNGVSNPTAKLSDFIGKQINLAHVYVEIVDMINTETGEATKAPRIIFFNEKGDSSTKKAILSLAFPAVCSVLSKSCFRSSARLTPGKSRFRSKSSRFQREKSGFSLLKSSAQNKTEGSPGAKASGLFRKGGKTNADHQSNTRRRVL